VKKNGSNSHKKLVLNNGANKIKKHLMEQNLIISNINDFIFCPRSIYFHNLYGNYDEHLYHNTSQVQGRISHKTIDEKKYTTRKAMLQGIDIYSEELGVIGKIDLFDMEQGILTERKNKITVVYDGYLLQIYSQYFCLIEMGYIVKVIRFYSISDNKVYTVDIPSKKEKEWLLDILSKVRQFQLQDKSFFQNKNKCIKCIYNQLCDYYNDD